MRSETNETVVLVNKGLPFCRGNYEHLINNPSMFTLLRTHDCSINDLVIHLTP
jgi:hypothetical protein